MKDKRHFSASACLLVIAFCLALAIAYLRIQSTLIGYQLGELKDHESYLLEQRSRLKVDLAKLTKKENLTILASRQQKNTSNDENSLASR
ncbi:MAG: hypothetical protein ACOH5I_05725 [Oligoflexus sp.]